MLARKWNGNVDWAKAGDEVWQYCRENPGAYTRDIANHFGVSRSTIISFLHRLPPDLKAQAVIYGIGKRRSPGPIRPAGFSEKAIAARKKKVPERKPSSGPKPFLAFAFPSSRSSEKHAFSCIEIPDRGCRWITGEVGLDGRYCGEEIHSGAFCKAHAAKAYVPEKEKNGVQ